MEYLPIVYVILKSIDESFENDNFSLENTLNHNKFKISEKRLFAILEDLISYGYITGISIKFTLSQNTNVSINRPRLTLLGIEYLENNTAMKRAYKKAIEIFGNIPI